MGGSDNPPAPFPPYHPSMWWQPDYSDSQGDAGGHQHGVQIIFKEAPTAIPSSLHQGGGVASTNFKDKKG